MGRIIIAPDLVEVEGPVVFLAGPTMSSTHWQDQAIALFQRMDAGIHIASPRRPVDTERDFDERMYNEQVDWETRYLRRAGKNGVVLFWLARESVHRCERAHAQTTRFELAEWKEYHRREGAGLVVGIEEGFTGARYIRRRFAQECPGVPICATLEATCRFAVQLIHISQVVAG